MFHNKCRPDSSGNAENKCRNSCMAFSDCHWAAFYRTNCHRAAFYRTNCNQAAFYRTNRHRAALYRTNCHRAAFCKYFPSQISRKSDYLFAGTTSQTDRQTSMIPAQVIPFFTSQGTRNNKLQGRTVSLPPSPPPYYGTPIVTEREPFAQILGRGCLFVRLSSLRICVIYLD